MNGGGHFGNSGGAGTIYASGAIGLGEGGHLEWVGGMKWQKKGPVMEKTKGGLKWK